MLQRFIVAATVLGLTAAFAVPFLAQFLAAILPAQVTRFLPSQNIPAEIGPGIVSAIVSGSLLAFALMILAQFGVRAPATR